MARGRFGGQPAVAVVLFAACLAVVFPMISAKSHVVGGSNWIIPANSSFYPKWASSQIFEIGDTLVFNFQSNQHTVVEVPKSSYDSCSTTNKIGPIESTGPATVTITTGGEHYYICSVGIHCSLNQKLAISVSGSSSSPSPVSGDSPGPTPPPTAGGSQGGSSPDGNSAAPLASAAAVAAGLSLLVALW